MRCIEIRRRSFSNGVASTGVIPRIFRKLCNISSSVSQKMPIFLHIRNHAFKHYAYQVSLESANAFLSYSEKTVRGTSLPKRGQAPHRLG